MHLKRLHTGTLFDTAARSKDLARKSVRGGMATMAGHGIQLAIGVCQTVILARLLTPADYGIIGMATVVVGFAVMFKDAGLSMATVQRESISHEQISTLFWLNLFICLLLGLCVLASAPLVAWFYGRTELTTVTAALSASFFIRGLTIQHQALLRRHMQFGTLTVINIASHIVSLIVAILLAMAGWRYWALVCSTLSTAMADTLLTLFFCPWLPGSLKKRTGVRDMLKFGGHLTGFNLINYFSRNADNLLIGKFIGADSLGLYAKAYQLFMLPIGQIRGPLTQVAMPVLSSLQNNPERYVKYFQRLIDIIATLTIPISLYFAVEGDFLIKLALGEQWLGAIPVFRILAISALIQGVSGTRGLVLLSHGFSGRFFYFGLFNAILTVMSFIIGIPFGIEGVAAAYAVANYVILIPSLYYCFHKTPVTVPLFLRVLVAPLLAGLLGCVCIVVLRSLYPGDSLLSHIIYALIFAIIYAGVSICRQSIRETLALIFCAKPNLVSDLQQ
jgi:PST family polysaccharide transporter